MAPDRFPQGIPAVVLLPRGKHPAHTTALVGIQCRLPPWFPARTPAGGPYPGKTQMAKAPLEIRSLARAHTKTAIRTLAGIMRDKGAPPAARIAASEALIDRGWGKATILLGTDPDAPLRIEVIRRMIVEPGGAEVQYTPSDTPLNDAIAAGRFVPLGDE